MSIALLICLSESGEPIEVYGHATAMSSSPDLTQSQSSDLSPKKLSGATASRANAATASPALSKYPGIAAAGSKVAGGPSSPAERAATLGRRGSVELTKSEEDLFKEGMMIKKCHYY